MATFYGSLFFLNVSTGLLLKCVTSNCQEDEVNGDATLEIIEELFHCTHCTLFQCAAIYFNISSP